MPKASSRAREKRKPSTTVPNIGALAKGRPPTIQKPNRSISQKSTNTIINTYHALNKSLSKARDAGDETTAKDLQTQLDALGGLETYQQASIQGQDGRRGGDSSSVLVSWLRPLIKNGALSKKRKLLEVGALSTRNACSTCGLFDVERIDLNSQGEGIMRQDFMERPLPKSEYEDGFDIISLSLVLNFVPDISQRGEMLRRVTKFLIPAASNTACNDRDEEALPALFLVLPSPCVVNSRYMTEEQLTAIMQSLGYRLCRRKQSTKLVYYLWKWSASLADESKQNFSKALINDGRARNNFCIVLKPASTTI